MPHWWWIVLSYQELGNNGHIFHSVCLFDVSRGVRIQSGTKRGPKDQHCAQAPDDMLVEHPVCGARVHFGFSLRSTPRMQMRSLVLLPWQVGPCVGTSHICGRYATITQISKNVHFHVDLFQVILKKHMTCCPQK